MKMDAAVVRRSSVAMWILAVVATVWFLRAAKALLIPIALAVLVSYALEPVVAWLERHRVHRMVGSAAVLVLVIVAVAAGGYALRRDITEVVEAVPKAAERAREMVTSHLGVDVSQNTEAAPTGTSGQVPPSFLQRAVSAVFAFAGHLVVIVFLVFFLLMSGHRMRDRLVEVIGINGDRRRTTVTIIDDINAQVQRYLLVLLVTGAIVGVATWLVLLWFGTQHAAMWGLLAGLFNSIPYFGPVIVSGGLLVIGLVQEGGLEDALRMAGASVVITSIEGWLIAPPLMGKVERMSALVVFLGLLLWTWIWGAWGTVLAVPVLVILKSVADHVERLRPVGRLMAP
jgi:predicted PurR-regulated permease PerM